ncbi:MAG: phosphatidate cytidylyltransferase [Enterobacterales bacterium]|nr:phosphatidate cytidylyltransferase [Enterobacterales bacterium]
MLKKRIITALLLLPAVFLLLFKLELERFSLILVLLVYGMALEWAKLSMIGKPIQRSLYALLVIGIILVLWQLSIPIEFWPSLTWPNYLDFEWPISVLLIASFMIFVAVAIVASFSKNNQWWQVFAMRELLGLILLPAFFFAFVSIRNMGYQLGDFYYGGKLLLFMLLLIWAADTGAFVTGKLFGKTKLTKVSPNKTWEGVLGGISLSLLIGWFGIEPLHLKVDHKGIYLATILFLAIISVYGDLFESALKRVAKVKDSGNLLPGHGGLLDRLDSTITVAPLFYLSFSYFGWFNA